MEPASTIIQICGGVSAVANAVGRDESRVYRWTYPREKGGTGGLIPSAMQQKLLCVASKNGWPLRPEDFFLKAKEAAQ